MAKAYGTLTILDLLDTATYIYYAEDEKGTGAKKAPDANSKYIGIYSGPAIDEGQPDVPKEEDWGSLWSGWQKYVGDKGEDGEPGRGISDIEIKYVPSGSGTERPGDDAEWSTTFPQVSNGQYLWVRTKIFYTEGDPSVSYSVSYIGVDGQDAQDVYYIETNQNEILKFIEWNEEIKNETLSFSPNNLSFSIYKKEEETRELLKLFKNEDDFSLRVDGNEDLEIKVSFIYNGTYNIPSDYLSIQDGSNSNGIFAFQSYYEALNSETDLLKALNQVVQAYFKIAIVKKNSEDVDVEIANKIINYRFGQDEDMAKFRVHATGITASIRQSKLQFDEEGLSVFNGGIKIYKTKEDTSPVFYGDVDGNLYLTGIINAQGGGKIGGFDIKDDMLVSSNESIQLRGVTGEIIANNITLGGGATVTDGAMSIGNIKINGTKDSGYIGTENWSITGQGIARFKDIYVDKAHIQNSVLEVGTVQSIGSLMLVKDSWTVKSCTSNEGAIVFVLDNQSESSLNLETGDYVFDGKQTFKISEIDGNEITVPGDASADYFPKVLTKFGKPEEDYILSFLGEKVENTWGFAHGNSITLASFEEKNGTLNYEPVLILGDLSSKNSGTGLYAENVFLKGSLVTRSPDRTNINNDDTDINGDNTNSNANISGGTYAGVNTKDGATATKFSSNNSTVNDSSHIIFWAGSATDSVSDIQKAPFQVTEQGSLYASQGVFEGSIISKSTIQGSKIYAAELHGWDNNDGEAALSIYDTARGIVFKNKTDNNVTTTLTISGDGLYQGDKEAGEIPFISLSGAPTFTGKFVAGDLEIENGTIKNEEDSGIKICSKTVSFQQESNSSSLLSIYSEGIVSTTNVNFQQEVQFGKKNEVSLVYKKTTEGYDLYVN